MKMKVLLFLFLAATSCMAGATDIFDFKTVSIAAGVNKQNRTTGGGADTKTNLNLAAGGWWKVASDGNGVEYGGGIEGNLLAINHRTVFVPQAAAFMFFPNDVSLIPHGGYSRVTGLTSGLDVIYPISQGATLRAGATFFQRSVDGAKGVLQLGVLREF